MFEGRNLLIATKHRKETVIAPLFSDAFGVHCFISDEFDTDSLGTFSGEIARKKKPFRNPMAQTVWSMRCYWHYC